MQLMRNRARLIAAIALTWHVVALAIVSTALSCAATLGSEHAGMDNCPLHARAPECSVHADKHGTHACDCPTIGCAQADAGLMALFGPVGVLTASADLPTPLDAGGATPRIAARPDLRARVPLSPPPRA